MSESPTEFSMKPMIILPPDMMSEADIAKLHENGICVVVAKEPNTVRFVDPIPSVSSRTQIENSAIQLSRRILNGQVLNAALEPHKLCVYKFVEILLQGTPLCDGPTIQEREAAYFTQVKQDEIRNLARQEAREERAAAKAAAAKKATPAK